MWVPLFLWSSFLEIGKTLTQKQSYNKVRNNVIDYYIIKLNSKPQTQGNLFKSSCGIVFAVDNISDPKSIHSSTVQLHIYLYAEIYTHTEKVIYILIQVAKGLLYDEGKIKERYINRKFFKVKI